MNATKYEGHGAVAGQVERGVRPHAEMLARRLQQAAYSHGYEDASPANATTRQAKTDAASRQTLADLLIAIAALGNSDLGEAAARDQMQRTNLAALADENEKMITALAAIDAELELPEDGCNSTGRTMAAVRELQARASSAQQQAQSLARAVMADQTAHDTWTRNALRFQLLLDGPHNFGVFVCGEDGSPDDSISNAELTAALDAMLGSAC